MKLDEVITEILQSGVYEGPEQITEAIMMRDGVSPEDLRGLVKNYVSTELRRRRAKNPVPPPVGLHEPQVQLDRQAAAARSGVSARIASYREHAHLWLEEQIPVGNGDWKHIGDCTSGDLEYVIQHRVDQGNRLLGSAARFQGWLELMREYQVTVLRKLPNHILAGSR